MNSGSMILLAVGAICLVVLVGQHLWPVPRWLAPILLFVGLAGILAGMGWFALSLALRWG
ncbi:hypothetical protein [uncultured Rhodospira sp.]|uniref:hypothetical protein n=1 Tax=uncultured Rhodospira sp. TaxID=1936189 RepID=UPI00261ADB9A|nr:hypothetical protein [uncultured Rhodospira sp.]